MQSVQRFRFPRNFSKRHFRVLNSCTIKLLTECVQYKAGESKCAVSLRRTALVELATASYGHFLTCNELHDKTVLETSRRKLRSFCSVSFESPGLVVSLNSAHVQPTSSCEMHFHMSKQTSEARNIMEPNALIGRSTQCFAPPIQSGHL